MKIVKCCVKNCHKPGESLFRFPQNREIKDIWISFCNNESWWTPNSGSRICSKHFETRYISTNEKITRLHQNSIPTINNNLLEVADPAVTEFLEYQQTKIARKTYLITDTNVCELVDDENDNPFRENKDEDDYMHNSTPTVPLEDFLKLKNANSKLQKEILVLRKRIKNLERTNKNNRVVKKKLKVKFLTSYQSKLVYNNKSTGKFWDKETIRMAICTRAACGTRGYNFLRKTGHPLPSIRFINKKLQPLNFKSGILKDFINLLKKIVNTMCPEDKHCGLFWDEMSIVPGYEYDPSTKSIIGKSNFPGDPDQDATHGLVFLLCGLQRRWKQVVAYYFTGNVTGHYDFLFQNLFLKLTNFYLYLKVIVIFNFVFRKFHGWRSIQKSIDKNYQNDRIGWSFG